MSRLPQAVGLKRELTNLVDPSSICSVARKLRGTIVYQLRPLSSCGGDALSDGEHAIQKKQSGPASMASNLRSTAT